MVDLQEQRWHRVNASHQQAILLRFEHLVEASRQPYERIQEHPQTVHRWIQHPFLSAFLLLFRGLVVGRP